MGAYTWEEGEECAQALGRLGDGRPRVGCLFSLRRGEARRMGQATRFQAQGGNLVPDVAEYRPDDATDDSLTHHSTLYEM